MSHSFRPTALALSMALVLSLLGTGCGEKTESDKSTTAQAEAAEDPSLVKVNPEMAKQFQVERLKEQLLETQRDLPGRIEANEQLVTRIGASVTGRVTDIQADVGSRVQAGQVLARVTSPELTSAQLTYLRARSATSQAERAVERAQMLIKADVIGAAEVQRREAELSIAKAELQAAADQLALLGIPRGSIERLAEKGQLSSHAGIVANRSGVVIERKVSQGQVAQPGDPLFTVADLSNVWVVGALPEQDASAVQEGQKIEISVPALGSRQFSGKVVYVSDTVSADTRTLMVRTQVDNADRALKPQMLALLRILGQGTQQVVVPESAVVRENDKDHVYVLVGDGVFKLTEVQLGTATKGVRPVIKGLSAGTPVVVDGAFHLNNERKRAELE